MKDDIFIPLYLDLDPEAESMMEQGRDEDSENNDLRDPWFHTEEGQQWLTDQGEQ